MMEVCEITSGYVRNNHLLPPKIEELGDVKCSEIAKNKIGCLQPLKKLHVL